MITVKFTNHLVRYFPALENPTQVDGETVAAILATLNERYPGLADYVVDENGRLRRHVNIFINKELIKDRETLSDPVSSTDQLYIFQALSGG